MRPPSRGLLIWLASGAVVSLAGLVAFGAIHDILISPIWASLVAGLPFVIVAGVAMGWAFHALCASGPVRPTWMWGLEYGAILWLSLVPMTFFAALLRITGVRASIASLEAPIEGGIALATGAAMGRILGGTWHSTIALAVATLMLALTMGGPVPLTTTIPATLLFVSFLALYPLAGLALVAVGRVLSHRAGVHRE